MGGETSRRGTSRPERLGGINLLSWGCAAEPHRSAHAAHWQNPTFAILSLGTVRSSGRFRSDRNGDTPATTHRVSRVMVASEGTIKANFSNNAVASEVFVVDAQEFLGAT